MVSSQMWRVLKWIVSNVVYFRRELRGFCVISSLIILSFMVFCYVFRRFHSKVTALTSSLNDIQLNVEKSGFSVIGFA
jgi:hypothetical protein